ncbi:MAG: hypothetical protein E7240_08945 [Lachnospiraceae bacterium]|nr:hypothetical protein [Lachnospiraceae bacterium]
MNYGRMYGKEPQNLNAERFYKNIIDQITEAHEKLGKARETMRLYYPLDSVNAYLGTSFADLESMKDMLNENAGEIVLSSDHTADGQSSASTNVLNNSQINNTLPKHNDYGTLPKHKDYGTLPERLHFSVSGDRLEVLIPPETVAYIDQKYEASDFLKELIQTFSYMAHELSIDRILALFHRYSDHVVMEEVPEECGFDFMIRFKDPSADEYCYCVKNEMGHWIYHRFMREDYIRLIS